PERHHGKRSQRRGEVERHPVHADRQHVPHVLANRLQVLGDGRGRHPVLQRRAQLTVAGRGGGGGLLSLRAFGASEQGHGRAPPPAGRALPGAHTPPPPRGTPPPAAPPPVPEAPATPRAACRRRRVAGRKGRPIPGRPVPPGPVVTAASLIL